MCSKLGEMIFLYFLSTDRKTNKKKSPVRVSNGVPLEDESGALHLAPLSAPSPKSRDKKRKIYQCKFLSCKPHQALPMQVLILQTTSSFTNASPYLANHIKLYQCKSLSCKTTSSFTNASPYLADHIKLYQCKSLSCTPHQALPMQVPILQTTSASPAVRTFR